MKKYIAISIFFLFSNSFSQVDLRAGMAIQFQSIPSLTDYINQNFAPSFDEIGTVSSAVIFSLEGGYRLGENSHMGLELAYLLNSYTYGSELGQYEFSYSNIMPTIIYYYRMDGTGYNFKFGGGAGIRLINAEEKPPGMFSSDYSATGIGFILKADGNTLLGGNIYANIGADIRYDINGEPENNGNKIFSPGYDENVNLNSISFGIRLGVTYQF